MSSAKHDSFSCHDPFNKYVLKVLAISLRNVHDCMVYRWDKQEIASCVCEGPPLSILNLVCTDRVYRTKSFVVPVQVWLWGRPSTLAMLWLTVRQLNPLGHFKVCFAYWIKQLWWSRITLPYWSPMSPDGKHAITALGWPTLSWF